MNQDPIFKGFQKRKRLNSSIVAGEQCHLLIASGNGKHAMHVKRRSRERTQPTAQAVGGLVENKPAPGGAKECDDKDSQGIPWQFNRTAGDANRAINGFAYRPA
jgi:hypothetical protein